MKPARNALFALILGVTPYAVAVSATDDAGDGSRSEQRARIAALKADAFERLRTRRAETLRREYPERTRVSVYIGVTVDRFVLQEVVARIDGGDPVRRTYTEAESASLRSEGLHRVLRTNVEPGSHRVELSFKGHLAGSKPEDAPISGSIDLDFDKTGKAKAMILPIAPEALRMDRRGGGGDRPTWRWRSETQDPRLRMVRYLRANDRRFTAAMELVEVAAAGTTGELPAGYHHLLAHSYLDFGMRQPAARALRAYTRRGSAREPYEDVRLRLAALGLARGELARAQRLLEDMEQHLTPAQRVHWQDLRSRALMAQGRYAEAEATLSEGDFELEVLTQPEQSDTQTLYMRYNHAVSMLRSGETDRGRTLLDRIGRMRPFNAAQFALRDRANVALGYHFLAAEQGATAKTLFHRVRLDGPYANRALLGLGRSEVAPRGTRQKRVAVGDEPEAGTYGIADTESGRLNREDRPERYSADAFRKVQLKPFRMAETAEEESAAQRRALVAWRELSGREIANPAVQEGMVSVGRVLEELSAYGDAQQIYNNVITELRDVRERLSQRAASLRAEAVSIDPAADVLAMGLAWRRGPLADVPDTRWLQELLASSLVHEAIGNILDLQVLARALQMPAGSDAAEIVPAVAGAGGADVMPTANGGGDALAASLSAAAEAETRHLQTLTAQALDERSGQMAEFMQAARRGMARINLRPAQREAEQRASPDATARGVSVDE